MEFCKRTRRSAAWRQHGAPLSVPQQGRLLGSLYRSSKDSKGGSAQTSSVQFRYDKQENGNFQILKLGPPAMGTPTDDHENIENVKNVAVGNTSVAITWNDGTQQRMPYPFDVKHGGWWATRVENESTANQVLTQIFGRSLMDSPAPNPVLSIASTPRRKTVSAPPSKHMTPEEARKRLKQLDAERKAQREYLKMYGYSM